MKTLRHTLLLAALPALLLTACNGDDDYHYPPVKQEFLTAQVGTEGISEVLTDGGEHFIVVDDGSGISAPADTTLRIVTNYEAVTGEDGRQGVRLYSSIKAVSPLPKPAADFVDGIKQDPARVTSIRMGRSYLNVLLDIKGQNKLHTFAFVEERVTTTATRRTVSLSLYHDDGDDVQAYSKRVYLSVPLAGYEGDGRELTVEFSVMDYDGEIKKWVVEGEPIK
jgi:hypothetical protein